MPGTNAPSTFNQITVDTRQAVFSSGNWIQAAQASTKPVFEAFLYFDNVLISQLDIADGSISFDSNQDVRASGSLTILDKDGTLTPTSMGSPLTPFGSRILVRAGFQVGADKLTVNLGWFLIWDMDVQEAWQTYTAPDGSTKQVRKGSRITVNIRDLMQLIVDYKFLAPEATQKNDAWAELVRLVGTTVTPLMPTWYTATSLKTGTAYGDSRMDAIKGIAAALNADPIIDTNGNFTLAKKTPDKTSIPNIFSWDTNLVDYSKSLSRDGVYNIVICKGKNAVTGEAIVAYETLNDGPTRWNGPFGPRPIVYQNDSLGGTTAVAMWAKSLIATIRTQNTQVMDVTCLPNPAIQLGDYADLTLRGANSTMQGRVVAFTYHAHGPMNVSLAMPNSWAA